MQKKGYIERTLELMTILTFTLLISVIFLQVFARFFLPKSPSWTEEISRFLFIYSVMSAAPLALQKGEYVKVDLILNKFADKTRRVLNIISLFFITIFSSIIAYEGITFGSLGIGQTSPAMGISMHIPYFSISFAGLFLTFYGILLIKDQIKQKGEKKEDLKWS